MRDDEPTPEEREAFAALPRERAPGDLLEERVVRALRSQGLLAPAGRRVPGRGRWMSAAVVAAVALVLFLGGVVVGQQMAQRAAADALVAARNADATRTAALVQRTGSAYVTALAALADRQRSATGREVDQISQGKEAALVALRAAAAELARLYPDDAAVARVLAALQEESKGVRPDREAAARQVLWF